MMFQVHSIYQLNVTPKKPAAPVINIFFFKSLMLIFFYILIKYVNLNQEILYIFPGFLLYTWDSVKLNCFKANSFPYLFSLESAR